MLSLGAVLAGLMIWQALTSSRAVPAYMLPTPASVWNDWWTLAGNGVLWQHTSATLTEALLGFLLAFVVGSAVAYPLARSRVVASILSPYVAGTQAMPILALAPLLMIWFGLGLFSKTLICAIIVFFPILVNTAVGLRTVDRSLLEAAWTEGAGSWRTLWWIEVPLALRTILGGVRMGLTLSLTGAIVAEFVASSAGLGYLMSLARSEYDAPLVFVAALTMVGLAVLGYLLINLVEYLVVDWD
jgi:NitT/TauT family transport system permease protein